MEPPNVLLNSTAMQAADVGDEARNAGGLNKKKGKISIGERELKWFDSHREAKREDVLSNFCPCSEL